MNFLIMVVDIFKQWTAQEDVKVKNSKTQSAVSFYKTKIFIYLIPHLAFVHLFKHFFNSLIRALRPSRRSAIL